MKCEFLGSNVPCQMSSKMWVTSHFHNFKGNQPLLYRTLNEPCQVIKSLGPQGTFRKLLIIIHEQQKHRHEHPDFNHRHFLTHLWARFLFRVSSLEPSQEDFARSHTQPNKLQMFIWPSQFALFKCLLHSIGMKMSIFLSLPPHVYVIPPKQFMSWCNWPAIIVIIWSANIYIFAKINQ